MRVIAGKWKGRSLTAPSGDTARPTTDRVKESMFNIMGIAWRGGGVLDLFAGSGALGIEALSRGAEFAVFVDQSVHSLRAVRDNLKRCEAEAQAVIWKSDWKAGLNRFLSEYERVGWIFLDPPYHKNLWHPVLTRIASSELIVEYGIICEHPRDARLEAQIGNLSMMKQKTYGDISLTLYCQNVAVRSDGGDL